MRRYGANRYTGWPGWSERLDRCVVETNAVEQCNRYRHYGPDGLYCAQHARMIAEGKPVFVPEDQ